jgi:excisionase family DNA binding protein
VSNAGLETLQCGYDGATMSPRTRAWLTVEEVAGQLGLSLATVYEEITAERLPAQRYGNSFLLRRADVDAYLARHGVVAG